MPGALTLLLGAAVACLVLGLLLDPYRPSQHRKFAVSLMSCGLLLLLVVAVFLARGLARMGS